MFNQFVLTKTDDLGFEKCSEQPSLFRRPGATLIFEIHQDDIYASGSTVKLAWLQENLGAVLKLKLAELMGPGSQYSYSRVTRTRVHAETIHIAPRESYIMDILDVLDLGDNKCQPMPTPTVQTGQKRDDEEPGLGEEDRRAYRRCVGILRHFLRYRPDIAYAVHEVSKVTRLSRRRRP